PHVDDLGRRAEPDLPPAGPGPGAPVDALPVESVALVLEADVVEGGPAHEIGGLAAVADGTLLVVGPAVPPEPSRRAGGGPPAGALAAPQGVGVARKAAGARL